MFISGTGKTGLHGQGSKQGCDRYISRTALGGFSAFGHMMKMRDQQGGSSFRDVWFQDLLKMIYVFL
jgi:hypothetical protein